MKKIALYIILFSYTTILLNPVAPYIADMVAHSFYLNQHIATVHYENGKLHVHKEVKEKAAKEEPAKQSPSSKKNNSANDHINQLVVDSWQYLQPSGIFTPSMAPGLAYIYLFTHYPPPRALA